MILTVFKFNVFTTGNLTYSTSKMLPHPIYHPFKFFFLVFSPWNYICYFRRLTICFDSLVFHLQQTILSLSLTHIYIYLNIVQFTFLLFSFNLRFVIYQISCIDKSIRFPYSSGIVLTGKFQEVKPLVRF